MMKTVICGGAIAIALASIVFLSCVSNGKRDQSMTGTNEKSGPVVESHAVYNEQLKLLMADLQKKTIEHWPTSIGDEHSPNENQMLFYDKAYPLARSLTIAADKIPGSVSDMVMLEADRRAFAAQAGTLRDQARQLSQAATRRDAKRMHELLTEIDATCRSCHSRFLDVSGPLSPL